MKIPFVDIHTHHPKNSAEILSVESLFLQDAGSTRNVNFPFSAAIHPWHTGSYSLKQIEAMLEEVVKKPGLIAIGETGLDKSYKTDYQHQKQVFGLHLEFAQRHSKPLIIHAVRSWNEIIEYLKHSKTPSILHGYSAGVVLTKQLIGLGCYFSVGKPVLQITPRFRESFKSSRQPHFSWKAMIHKSISGKFIPKYQNYATSPWKTLRFKSTRISKIFSGSVKISVKKDFSGSDIEFE